MSTRKLPNTRLLAFGALLVLVLGTAASAGAQGAAATPETGTSQSNRSTVGSFNMRVIAHNDFGGGDLARGGEGFAEVIAPNGHRILYVANESGPVCFNIVDVTNPRQPTLLSRISEPGPNTHCNNLDASQSRHVLVVANQVAQAGQSPAGVQIYDIADPIHPKQISYLSTAGPYSRGVHAVWLEGDYLYMSSGQPTAGPWGPAFVPRRPGKDDQIEVIASLKDPSQPTLVGEWWWPGTAVGDSAPLPMPNRIDSGCRAHNTQVYPDNPNIAYVGYIDCGIVVLNITDKAHPKVVAMLDDSPPEPGFTHTVMPIDNGRYLVVTHEAVQNYCADFPKVMNFVDGQTLQRISYAPLPSNTVDLCEAGGRFGSHNISENVPDEPAFHSDSLIIGSFFNGGVRIYDVSDIHHPREVAWNIPPVPQHPSTNAPTPDNTIQINDVYIDNRGVIFAVDRFGGGLYVLESPVIDKAVHAGG